jgi:transketolase C-terminal domain/subunit
MAGRNRYTTPAEVERLTQACSGPDTKFSSRYYKVHIHGIHNTGVALGVPTTGVGTVRCTLTVFLSGSLSGSLVRSGAPTS